MSTYVNKVDRKGRVSVPATFRSTLATHREPNLVVLFPSFRLPALDGSGGNYVEEMNEHVPPLKRYPAFHGEIARTYMGGSDRVEAGSGAVHTQA